MKILVLTLLLFCTGFSAQTAKKPSRHTAASSSHHSNSRVRGKSSKSRSRATHVASGPRRQQAPSSDRYKEIQEALIAKGYLKSPADGTWNADTADALRRFQADQNLSSTGKVNSLSLIALGLGPKSESSPKPLAEKP